LAILLDVLAAILSEGLATHESIKSDVAAAQVCSQIFIAFDPQALGSSAHLAEVVDGWPIRERVCSDRSRPQGDLSRAEHAAHP
jgi:LDH2 family malate/lactate/ureidoglycolate dehydrogenase